jgi:hypothetical protein
MKKLITGVALFFSVLTFQQANAQVGVNVNINIGSQPAWGPVGYDHVDYYYLPDIESYYYVPTRQFIYLSNGNWVFAYGLPPAYRTYDLYSGYKVVINQPKAYQYFTTHKVKYVGYKGNRSQVIIRNSDDPRYYVVKGHPKYSKGNNAAPKKVKVSKSQGAVKQGQGNKGRGRGNKH